MEYVWPHLEFPDSGKYKMDRLNEWHMQVFWECKRKIAHETVEEAKEHLNRHPKEKLNIYECKYCGKYHVGHDEGFKVIRKSVSCE